MPFIAPISFSKHASAIEEYRGLTPYGEEFPRAGYPFEFMLAVTIELDA
jgi:hypothetical protein